MENLRGGVKGRIMTLLCSFISFEPADLDHFRWLFRFQIWKFCCYMPTFNVGSSSRGIRVSWPVERESWRLLVTSSNPQRRKFQLLLQTRTLRWSKTSRSAALKSTKCLYLRTRAIQTSVLALLRFGLLARPKGRPASLFWPSSRCK
jgi:hypothetical protein